MILFVHFYNKCYFKSVCTEYSKTNTQERLCTTYIKQAWIIVGAKVYNNSYHASVVQESKS